MNANASNLSIASLLLLAANAHADFATPDDYGWQRFDQDSTYFEWDDFSNPLGGNTPDIGMFPNPLPTGWSEPDVVETTGTGFITSTGNIYSFAAATEFEVSFPNYGYGSKSFDTTVLVQIRTQGNELDPESLAIGSYSPVETTELDRISLGGGGPGGFQVDTLFRFELPGNFDDYLLEFKAIGSSMSLDKLAIDTFATSALVAGPFSGTKTNTDGTDPIPAPASATLIGLAACASTRRRR
ncbi:MAG: hypothetical protein ED559_04710 [Phycisphaera sp.]|nr:MAG: hypothetical protein ED559_04710 [Phycisphaera sp.]